MNGSGLGWMLRLLGVASVAAAIAATTVMPARADDHDRDRRRHYVRRDEHREWRPYPGYVAPAPVYAPPAVVYSPPPAPVYAPPIAPSLNVVIPLRF